MTDSLPPIYFYIPPEKWPNDYIPDHPDGYWEWMKSRPTKWLAWYHWTLQTYLHLKNDDFPCKLVDTLPNEGIVLSHRYLLPDNLKPTPKLLIVCLQADAMRHPYAQLHVVQNPAQEIPRGLLTLWESYHIPHWPQPGLIPRDPLRGDKFENIAFIGYGYSKSLAAELQEPSWYEQLNSLGLNWHLVKNFEEFNDYSYIDAILAVRNFQAEHQYDWKPASKLYNCWSAGVPAILGCESAYRAERKNELDYIEVTSPSDAILALKRLRDGPALRQAMIENGRVRSEEIQPAKMVARWETFLIDKAIPAYQRWCATPIWQQEAFLKGRRYLSPKIDSIRNRFKSMKVWK